MTSAALLCKLCPMLFLATLKLTARCTEDDNEARKMTNPAPETLYLYTDPAFKAPTPEDVRAVIQTLAMTADQVAGLVGVTNGRAVRRWLAPQSSKTHANIDYATWRLLLLEAGLVRLQKRRPQREKPLIRTKANRSKRPKIDIAEEEKEAGLAAPGQHK